MFPAICLINSRSLLWAFWRMATISMATTCLAARVARFPQYEPHTGEPGRGDVCKPTSAEVTLEWGCPVGCTQSTDGESTASTAVFTR